MINLLLVFQKNIDFNYNDFIFAFSVTKNLGNNDFLFSDSTIGNSAIFKDFNNQKIGICYSDRSPQQITTLLPQILYSS